MQALRFLLGGNWQKHQQRGWRTPNPISQNMGGNRGRRGWWNRASFTLKFGLASTVQPEPSSDPNMAPSLLHHSRLSRRPGSPGSTRSRSTSLLCRSLHLPLSLFAHLPMWPPTRHVWPPSRSVCRGRGVGKEGLPSGMCGRADLSGSSTIMARGTAQLTIDTSHLSRATGPLHEGPPTTTELHCRGREEGRRPRTWSCMAKVVGYAWLYWQPKLGVVGASRPRSFCPLLPRPRRNRHHISSKAGWRLRGCAGGLPLSLRSVSSTQPSM